MPTLPFVFESADAPSGSSSTYSVPLGQTAQGRVSTLGDHDWFRVTLTAGETYSFAAVGTGVSPLVDPILSLRNANGMAVVFNDDGGPGFSSSLTYTASVSGTYFLDVGAYGERSTGQYGLAVSLGTRPSFDVDMGAGALNSSSSWSAPASGVTLTYGFRASPASYGAGNSDISTFERCTPDQIAAIERALQYWSDVSGVRFTRVEPAGYTDSATMLFANYTDPDDGAGAFAYYPGSTGSAFQAGDVWLNTSVSRTGLPLGGYSFQTILHEIGHALGLSHPGDYNAAPGLTLTYEQDAQFVEDSRQYTVMSYFDESATGANTGSARPSTPMLLDILQIQNLYGVNNTTRTGDTVYGFNSNAGEAFNLLANSLSSFSIWDAGGSDTLDASGYGQHQTIDLNQGTFSSLGAGVHNVSIAIGAVIENAVGGSGEDLLRGNAANNILSGQAGHDRFEPLAGNDTVLGGGSFNDSIVYSGSRADYQLTAIGGGFVRVTDLRAGAPDGIDVASGVEVLNFADESIFVEMPDNASIARLYAAALSRRPDPGGLSGWADIYADAIPVSAKAQGVYVSLAGTNYGPGLSIAGGFIQSPEFVQRYGMLDNQQYVTTLYQNVLGRAPDAAGLDGWLQLLASSFTRDMVLVGFSESVENIALTSNWLITV